MRAKSSAPLTPHGKCFQTGVLLLASVLATGSTALAQTKWYKFDKAFINSHYGPHSAIGTLRAQESHPAKNAHTVSCGGEDGELHMGIPENAIVTSSGQAWPAGFCPRRRRRQRLWNCGRTRER